MKYKNLNKNRSILLAHDLITYDITNIKKRKKEFNVLKFIENIELTSNIDFKPYKGVSYNESGESVKISSKMKLLTTFYLVKKFAGQLPCLIKAKKSVANFNIRAGMDIGVKVSLRKKRLENFYKNLNYILLPVKGTKYIKTLIKQTVEKDYSLSTLTYIQPRPSREGWNNKYKNKKIWTIKQSEKQIKRKEVGEEIKDLINLSNRLKIEQERTGINVRYRINRKINKNKKGYILNYFIIP